MPPILLLKGDDKFYGTLKPEKGGDYQKLEKKALPPHPASDIALTNNFQREQGQIRMTENINDPDATERDPPKSSAELNIKDIKKLQTSKDVSGFSQFINNPLGLNMEESMETEARLERQGREVAGIEVDSQGLNFVGLKQVRNDLIDKPAEAVVDTATDYGNRAMAFVETKGLQLVALLGGLYLAGQFLRGVGSNPGKSKSSD